ncbi:hypothetical protein FOL47_007568 [Perkinsus chesapeaki]|uniref:Uncharacterized protein n=1 Tax=Perkinsus chesapeaki TaxID=330153 RepID=A0A7J6LJN9_PERCH|nr:hypothetical protein FOL47_007568 [Perkinsus chesapeaki]
MSSQESTRLFQELRRVLAEHDKVYGELERERQRGWESEAVGKLWEIRQKRLSEVRENSDGSGETKKKNCKTPGYRKYLNFYKKKLPEVCWRAYLIDHKKRFLDIGCAPGGLCAFFVEDLSWSGIGFSLPPEDGGLELKYHSDKLKFDFCDMAREGEYLRIAEKVRALDGEGATFGYVNLGVVIGQHQVDSMGETTEVALQCLTVCQNSFLAMFDLLKVGGDCQWVFASANLGPWFYFLDKLSQVFEEKIHLCSTLVPSRSPVYAICRKFNPNCEAAVRWRDELLSMNITEENLQRWSYRSWEEAQGIVSRLAGDLHKIWDVQREGLLDIRKSAEASVEVEEVGKKKELKMLSGAADHEDKYEGRDHTGRSKQHTPSRADMDMDWRSAPRLSVDEKPSFGRMSSEKSTTNRSSSGATGRFSDSRDRRSDRRGRYSSQHKRNDEDCKQQ